MLYVVWRFLGFFLNIPYDLLSEEVGLDSMQPGEDEAVTLLWSRLLHQINHKCPTEKISQRVFFTKYFKINWQQGIDVLFMFIKKLFKKKKVHNKIMYFLLSIT